MIKSTLQIFFGLIIGVSLFGLMKLGIEQLSIFTLPKNHFLVFITLLLLVISGIIAFMKEKL